MNSPSKSIDNTLKLTFLALCMIGACLLIYYSHMVLQKSVIFTHFFYIPIILAGIWWKRRGILFAATLGAILITSHFILKTNLSFADDCLRALMFLVVASFVALLSERKEESEIRYREFFTTSRDAVFITTARGQWIDFNDASMELFGYDSREELLKTPIAQRYQDPEERAGLLKIIEKKGFAKEYPCRLNRKDGTVIDTLINTVPIRRPDGSAKSFIGTIRDITDRKRAEKALQQAHRRLDEIIEYLPDATFVIDADSKVIAWNKAIEKMTGVPKAEMIGKGDYEYTVPFYGDRRPILIDLAFLPDEEFEIGKYDAVRRSADTLYGEVYVPKTYGGKGAYLFATASRLHDASGKYHRRHRIHSRHHRAKTRGGGSACGQSPTGGGHGHSQRHGGQG